MRDDKLIARLFSVLMPAVVIGGVVATLSPAGGVAVGIGLLGLGLSETTARPERGER